MWFEIVGESACQFNLFYFFCRGLIVMSAFLRILRSMKVGGTLFECRGHFQGHTGSSLDFCRAMLLQDI